MKEENGSRRGKMGVLEAEREKRHRDEGKGELRGDGETEDPTEGGLDGRQGHPSSEGKRNGDSGQESGNWKGRYEKY